MVRAVSHDNPLEERYSHDILIKLLECGSMMKTELLRSVSKSSCMIGRLEHLEEAGLVETYNDTFSYNTKWVSLTPKGFEVARLLKQIRDIMDDITTVNEDQIERKSNTWDDYIVGSFSQSRETVKRSVRKQDPRRNPSPCGLASVSIPHPHSPYERKRSIPLGMRPFSSTRPQNLLL